MYTESEVACLVASLLYHTHIGIELIMSYYDDDCRWTRCAPHQIVSYDLNRGTQTIEYSKIGVIVEYDEGATRRQNGRDLEQSTEANVRDALRRVAPQVSESPSSEDKQDPPRASRAVCYAPGRQIARVNQSSGPGFRWNTEGTAGKPYSVRYQDARTSDQAPQRPDITFRSTETRPSYSTVVQHFDPATQRASTHDYRPQADKSRGPSIR
jgi:hypothetical protein